MSPIQRDGIHAYILLPREFKRQCRFSRLKVIQSLVFLFPPNSFGTIKFKNSNVHYNLWGYSTSNSVEMLCYVSLNVFSFLSLEKHWLFDSEIWGHCMFDMTKPLIMYADPRKFCLAVRIRWSHLDPGTISDSFVRKPPASYHASQNQMVFARTNCLLLFQLQKLNAFVPSKTELQSNGTQHWSFSLGQIKTFLASTRRGVQVK